MIIYLFPPLYSLGVFGKIHGSFFHVELAQQPETVNMKNVLRLIRVLLNDDVYFNLSVAKGGFYVICLTREAMFYYKSKHGEEQCV